MTAHLNALEQKEANTPQRNKWQEIIKLRTKINQTETKRTIQRINKTRNGFFEKINKINKPLARISRGHRDCIQINKIRNEKGDMTTTTVEIKNIIRSYYKSLGSRKLENLDEMDNFLDTQHEANFKQNQINPLSHIEAPKEIEAFINSLPTKKETTQDQMDLVENSMRLSKKT